MKIRLAKNEDFAPIARLHRQTIRKVNSKDYTDKQIRAWSSRTTAKKFRNNASKCRRWVAVVDNKRVVKKDLHPVNEEKIKVFVMTKALA